MLQPQLLIGRFLVNLRQASNDISTNAEEDISRFSAVRFGITSNMVGNIGESQSQTDEVRSVDDDQPPALGDLLDNRLSGAHDNWYVLRIWFRG
jgi:hypothetical protein